jgi:dTDP-4-dehydrorhamnose 3,5-epimerase
MTFQETKIKGCYLIDFNKNEDQRGFFSRIFCQETLLPLLKGKSIRQVNRTFSRTEGLVRGLHFQNSPYAEIKIVYCLKGKVWDVAVDLRKGSPTFLHYHSVTLTENNYQCFFIPEGCAHGFQTLAPNCEMLYFHTEDYNIDAEGVINSIDPRISIKWPKIITERSERDNNSPMLDKNFLGIKI